MELKLFRINRQQPIAPKISKMMRKTNNILNSGVVVPTVSANVMPKHEHAERIANATRGVDNAWMHSTSCSFFFKITLAFRRWLSSSRRCCSFWKSISVIAVVLSLFSLGFAFAFFFAVVVFASSSMALLFFFLKIIGKYQWYGLIMKKTGGSNDSEKNHAVILASHHSRTS